MIASDANSLSLIPLEAGSSRLFFRAGSGVREMASNVQKIHIMIVKIFQCNV
ncbi:MAG: hypothetical protein AAF823_14965 [Planctomycetota bacterium]